MTMMQQPQPNQKREYWHAHYEQWQASGLSCSAYCRQSDIRVTAFYYWKSVFERSVEQDPGFMSTERSMPTQQPSAFIPLSSITVPEALTLTIGDVALTLPRNMTELELTTWVRALRSA